MAKATSLGQTAFETYLKGFGPEWAGVKELRWDTLDPKTRQNWERVGWVIEGEVRQREQGEPAVLSADLVTAWGVAIQQKFVVPKTVSLGLFVDAVGEATREVARRFGVGADGGAMTISPRGDAGNGREPDAVGGDG